MTPHVVLQNVRFRYRGDSDARFQLAVDTLSIDRGERVAIIGPSGSGKTTLLNLIAGILLPAEGSVSLDNAVVSSLQEADRRALRIGTIGMVFQEFQLLEYLTVLDNILLPLRVAAGSRVNAEARAKARQLAGALGVGHTITRLPAQLSQGERQRVAISRALIAGPTLLMGDEPTGNLDPETADLTIDLLFEHARQRDATLLVVTHQHSLLPRFDRVIDLHHLLRSRSAQSPEAAAGEGEA